MKIRFLIATLSLVLLLALTLGSAPTGKAKMQSVDSPDGDDCELRAFQANVACTDKLYTLWQAYLSAPTSCSSTCQSVCQSNPSSSECLQCVSDCSSARYNSYVQAEESFGTCGICPASLDFCAAARDAMQVCNATYIECGGFTVAGCSEAYANCRLASGIESLGRNSTSCQ